MNIFAHRGVASLFPENTMVAFQEAVRLNSNGIELDVQLTKDGVPVVIHDETLERTTNGTGWVKDTNYEELRQLNASYKFGNQFGHCPVPTLKEVCELILGTSTILNIELKNEIISYPGLEEKVNELIQSFHIDGQVVISSFNHESLKYFRTIAPDVQIAALSEKAIENAGEYLRDLGAKGYHPNYLTVTKELVDQLNGYGIAIRPYTVNDSTVMKQFLDWGVDSVITDYPQNMIPLK